MYTKAIRGALLVLFFVTALLSTFQWWYTYPNASKTTSLAEAYDPSLHHLNSIEQTVRWLDSTAQNRGITSSSRAYVDLVDTLIRKRFLHGYAHYRLSDDYISHLLGRIVWSHLSAIVDPDDILRFSHAACSQQSIVFMAILKRKGYRTQKIGLKGHFCTGVFYEGGWHYYDTNKEPRFSKSSPIPSAPTLAADKNQLYQAYKGILSKGDLDEIFRRIELSESDVLPGYRVRILHKITYFLSRFAWAIFGLGYLLSFVVERFFWVKHVRYHRVPFIQ